MAGLKKFTGFVGIREATHIAQDIKRGFSYLQDGGYTFNEIRAMAKEAGFTSVKQFMRSENISKAWDKKYYYEEPGLSALMVTELDDKDTWYYAEDFTARKIMNHVRAWIGKDKIDIFNPYRQAGHSFVSPRLVGKLRQNLYVICSTNIETERLG